jgi:hypothetical protein
MKMEYEEEMGVLQQSNSPILRPEVKTRWRNAKLRERAS